MKKILLRLLMLLVLTVGAAAAVWYYFYQQVEEKEKPLVIFGNVDIREVQLAFNSSERIERILVREGAEVREGQLLAVLETAAMQYAVARAEAQVAEQEDVVSKLEAGTRQEEIRKVRAELEAAGIEAADARRTYNRLRSLAAKDMASQERADQAEARAETAAARVKVAEENLSLALDGPRKEDIAAAKSRLRALQAELALRKESLADAHLYAPSDGVIRNRILEPGDMAFPDRPVFSLALTNPVWVRAYVSEPDLGRIIPGMRAFVTTDSFPGKKYDGWIGYISPAAEFTPKSVETREVRTHLVYQVRVYVCNPQNELRLGMPATVTIPLERPENEYGMDRLPPCEEK